MSSSSTNIKNIGIEVFMILDRYEERLVLQTPNNYIFNRINNNTNNNNNYSFARVYNPREKNIDSFQAAQEQRARSKPMFTAWKAY